MTTTATAKKNKPQTTPASTAAAAKRDASATVTAALASHPGATPAELVKVTGLGRSTIGKILAKMAANGTAVRTPGGRAEGGRQAADTWTLPSSDGETAGEPTAADSPPTNAAPTAPGKRSPLGKGQLRAMVAQKLQDHPEIEFTPVDLSRLLDGRSSGAISNALDKLVAEGHARQVKDKPRTFTHDTPANT